jgi:hypothetical protein
MKYVKKLVNEGHSLAWTLAGTALVLITLSGDTKSKGLWISGIALGAHLIGVLVKKDENNE